MEAHDLTDRLRGRTAVVAGLGVSGRAAARLLRERGATVVGVDERRPDADLSSFDAIDWDSAGLLVVSPVFNPRTPFILEAQRRGIPTISEVELAWLLRVPCARTGAPAPWIGITGTNGKTSTTQMVSAMLTGCGLRAPAVGNIGDVVSLAAVDPSNDVLCVELSSFQMHFTDSLALEDAAITNIAADHLDWHGGMEAYAADKSKVFHGVTRTLVYNAQDARVAALARDAEAPGARRVGFTLQAPQEGQIGVEDGWIVDASGLAGGEPGRPTRLARVTDFPHLTEPDGTVYPHLLADALTALALVLGHGADPERAIAALKSFSPGGHRIATVAVEHTDGGDIRFVDDSKATNAHAARASLSSYPDGSVVWICGGLAKGARFEDLVADMRHVLRGAVVIGRDQEPMLSALRSQAPGLPVACVDPDSGDVMGDAVAQAGRLVGSRGIVLMAPACASMDQFRSYADRGDRFADAARAWVQRHEGN